MLEAQLHLISAVLILLAVAVPIYLTIKLKDDLRKLTAILSIFILIHAVYQVVGFFGLTLLADGVFEPLSAGVLIFFGIVYSGIDKQRSISIQKYGCGMEPWYVTPSYEQHYNNATFGSIGHICMASSPI